MVCFRSDITIVKTLAMSAILISRNDLSASVMAIANDGNFGNQAVPLPQPELEHQPERPKVVAGKALSCVCSVFRFISAKSSMPDTAGKASAGVLAALEAGSYRR